MFLIDYTNSSRLVYSRETRLLVNRNTAAVTDVVVYSITGYLTTSFTMRSHGEKQCTRACTAKFQIFFSSIKRCNRIPHDTHQLHFSRSKTTSNAMSAHRHRMQPSNFSLCVMVCSFNTPWEATESTTRSFSILRTFINDHSEHLKPIDWLQKTRDNEWLTYFF